MSLYGIFVKHYWLILDAPSDACCIKRKSTAGVEGKDESSVDGASPEKKAKLEEKAAVEVESNGREDAKTAA